MWQLIGLGVTMWLLREMVRLWHQEDTVEWTGSLGMTPTSILDEFSEEPIMAAILFGGRVCAYRPNVGTFERPSADAPASCEGPAMFRQSTSEGFKDVSTFLLRSPIFMALPIHLKMPVLDAMTSSLFRSKGVCPIMPKKKKGKKGGDIPDSKSGGGGPILNVKPDDPPTPPPPTPDQ